MKRTAQSMRLFAAALFAFGSLAGEARAGLIVEFSQEGADTIVSYSGTLDFSGLSFSSSPTGIDSGVSLFAGQSGLVGLRWNTGIGNARRYDNPWSSSPDFTMGNDQINQGTATFTQQFDLFNRAVIFNPNDFVGDVWAGSGTTTFFNVIVNDLVNLNTPVVWALANSVADTVTWKSSVPEPSTALLFSFGAAGLFVRRRKS